MSPESAHSTARLDTAIEASREVRATVRESLSRSAEECKRIRVRVQEVKSLSRQVSEQRLALLRKIGPRPENLTKSETEVLTDEKRRLIQQIDSSRIP